MEAMLFSLVTLATQWLRPRYNARLRLLEAQIRMLRSRIDSSRIVPTPQERAELLRLGAEMDHDIDEVMHVVVPATYRKWLRQLRGAKSFRPSGRPRTVPDVTVRDKSVIITGTGCASESLVAELPPGWQLSSSPSGLVTSK